MPTVDFFYLSLGIGFLILVGCVVAITVQINRILQDVKSITEDVADATNDLSFLKDGIKSTALTVVAGLIDRFKRGGDKS